MSLKPDHKLEKIAYMQFPFRMGDQGAQTSTRVEHIREQIEQIIYTIPGERVYRETFGAGVKSLVFEPNQHALAKFISDQLKIAIEPSLQGEIDPLSLAITVRVSPDDAAKLEIDISYLLAAIGHRDRFTMTVGR